jgi:2-isopropylmalate synthase
MYTHGVDPELDFSDMPDIASKYERLTRMHIYERQPYCGQLVFAAFSGSHQDAIAKGMECRKKSKKERWDVPYLPIDPEDVGRKYDSDVIRINSQSGKGGVGYVLKNTYGIDMPAGMKEAMGYAAKSVSDHTHSELRAEQLYTIFEDNFVMNRKVFDIIECHFKQINGIEATATFFYNGKEREVTSCGNGRLDAISNAIKKYFDIDFKLMGYEQHALTESSRSKAISYLGVQNAEGVIFWGAGIDDDIIKSSYKALVSAVNNMLNK